MTELSHNPLSENLFQQGIEQFNQGEYYACHDTLEAIWMEAPASEKPFYQGILQLAVALYHLGNHNWQGAAMLFGEGLRRLQPYEPSHFGVDVAGLVDCGFAWLTALQTLGPEQVAVLAAVAANQRPQADQAQAVVTPDSGPLESSTEIAELDFALPALYISLDNAFSGGSGAGE
ncbi:MAG TPA: DUF309 domain-containing protein [Trichocoleus sp.]